MSLERWSPERHLGMLGDWLRARGLAEHGGDPGLYPEFGLVADSIAIGFLYRTDAPAVAWLDGVVSDPYSDPKARAVALGELVAGLYDEADRQQIRIVFSTTAAPTLVALGVVNGAHLFPGNYTFIARRSA